VYASNSKNSLGRYRGDFLVIVLEMLPCREYVSMWVCGYVGMVPEPSKKFSHALHSSQKLCGSELDCSMHKRT
jgi:hypothetical protein